MIHIKLSSVFTALGCGVMASGGNLWKTTYCIGFKIYVFS